MIEEEEKLSGREDSSDLSLGEVEQLAVPAGSPKHPLYVSYKTKLVHYRGVDHGAMT